MSAEYVRTVVAECLWFCMSSLIYAFIAGWGPNIQMEWSKLPTNLPEFVNPVLGVGKLSLQHVVVLLQLREDLLGLLLLPPLRPSHHQDVLDAEAQILAL